MLTATSITTYAPPSDPMRLTSPSRENHDNGTEQPAPTSAAATWHERD